MYSRSLHRDQHACANASVAAGVDHTSVDAEQASVACELCT
jgi:hypothetical protein